jgi:hypothetical protein
VPTTRLVIFDETVRGIDLPGSPVILGRSRRVDIPIRDRLLSRKHCSIVPAGQGFYLIDLKSSNGTFLNGKKIDREELKLDDIIEIGSTVMVLLSTGDTWKRGGGLPRLRNLGKAKELIQAIHRREVVPEGLRAGRTRPPAGLRQFRSPTTKEREFLEWACQGWWKLPAAKEFVESYLENRLMTLIARGSPELSELLSQALEKLLVRETFEGDAAAVRERIRRVAGELMAAGAQGAPASPAGEAEGVAPGTQGLVGVPVKAQDGGAGPKDGGDPVAGGAVDANGGVAALSGRAADAPRRGSYNNAGSDSGPSTPAARGGGT